MEELVKCQLGQENTPRKRQDVLVGGICPWVTYVHVVMKRRTDSPAGIQCITIVNEKDVLDVQVTIRLTMSGMLSGNYKSNPVQFIC